MMAKREKTRIQSGMDIETNFDTVAPFLKVGEL